jgi:multisubunit Na+/H+ antiporter MnhB subunit
MTGKNNRGLAERFSVWVNEGGERLEKKIEAELAASPPEQDELRIPGAPAELPPYEHPRVFGAAKYRRWMRYAYSVLATLLCVGIIGILLVTIQDFPMFGDPTAPSENEVTRFYIENSMEETGAVNVVTAIILDYRGFDTLGESHVLFIALCTVMILLRLRTDDPAAKIRAESDDRVYEPRNDVILQTGANILVPIILLFGIYVLLNGHLSPGGGFSGGVVIGAGFILYLISFGFAKTGRFLTFRVIKTTAYLALTFYAVSKGYFFLMGANGWESGISAGNIGSIFSAGLLLPLSVAVGCVVACTMYMMYALFRKGDL